MARQKQEVLNSVCKYGEVISKVFDKVQIRLFGSYHTGKANIHSDIDVAVVSDDFEGIDYILAIQILNRLKLDVDILIEAVPLTYTEINKPEPGSIASYIAKNSEVII